MLSASKSGGAGGASGYNLTRSLRTRASASAYLNRTFTTPTSSTIYTWSSWVKRGTLSTTQYLFGASTTTNFGFNSSNNLIVTLNGTTAATTTAVYRDPSSWYHVVYVQNGSAQTIYVNNISVATGTTANTVFNTAIAHQLAAANTTNYFDGYLTEVNFIDGQALTPSSFGSINATTGVWQPARYTGTYGTNGFYLPFTDNSALTTSSNVGLGKDFSGNGNYWTTNNISITAGVTYDSMTDVPTLTSATAANFAVLNPLRQTASGAFSNGNLTGTAETGTPSRGLCSTIVLDRSGKWYAEVTFASQVNNWCGVTANDFLAADLNTAGQQSVLYYALNGNKFVNGTSTAYGATYTTETIGIAFDGVAGTVTFYKANVSQGAITLPSSTVQYVFVQGNAAGSAIAANWNFGQRPFTYTPPTGFVSLNTFNLPTSTILKGNTVMDATLYTGTGASLSVTNTAAFKPDLVWVKSRSAATDHKWTDSVRGVTIGLVSNSTAAETTDTQGLTAFNSNGFTVGTNTTYNNLAATYVGWQWQAGQGSTSSNTNGAITSTVSVNASAGFSIATYTGNLTAAGNSSIGHGLGVAPSVVISKRRNNTSSWIFQHISLSANNYLELNATTAAQDSVSVGGGSLPKPTSSVFYGSYLSGLNVSGDTFVAYCFAPIAGYSAFGSYTGNGSTDGTFVYLGFRPKFVMIKGTSVATNWNIFDSSRNTYNLANLDLYPNVSDAETVDQYGKVDLLSNGFKLRPDSTTFGINQSGAGYIYMAFAESPFRNSLAR